MNFVTPCIQVPKFVEGSGSHTIGYGERVAQVYHKKVMTSPTDRWGLSCRVTSWLRN